MSGRKQTDHMWGCRVVWNLEGDECFEEWAEGVDIMAFGKHYFYLVFTKTRREILPLVLEMRNRRYAKSAKAVKVSIPELP